MRNCAHRRLNGICFPGLWRYARQPVPCSGSFFWLRTAALNTAKLKIRTHSQTQCSECPIRRLALFHGVPEDQVEWTQGFRSAQIEVAAKRDFVDEGQLQDSLYTLFQGWAVVYKTLPNGKRQIFRIALPGDFVGYQPDLGGPSDVSIRSITPVVVCAFPRAKFWDYLRTRPDITDSLNRMNGYYIGHCQHYLMGMGRKSALERVGFLLMDLWTRCRELKGVVDFSEERGIDFPLSQEDMGDTIGISSVHVNRTLRELRDEGLIHLEGKHLKILDETTLSEMSRFDVELVRSRYHLFY